MRPLPYLYLKRRLCFVMLTLMALLGTASLSDTQAGAASVGTITLYHIPTANGGAGAITVGPDSALWFTNPAHSEIGRIAAT